MVSISLDSLIADAITQIGVPPAMRERAEDNMRTLVQQEGLGALQAKVQAARTARAKASKWLNSRAEAQQANSKAPALVQESFLRAVKRHVQLHQDKKWAAEFYSASSSIETVGGFDIFANRLAGRIVCDRLGRALSNEDFFHEHPVLRAGVLAEVANIFSIFAKRYNDYGKMAFSIVYYRYAVEAIRQSNFPEILPVIQMNRANAIVSYSELIHRRFIEKFREDIAEIERAESFDPGIGLVVDQEDAEELKTAVRSISDFYFGNKSAIRERAFQNPPIDEVPLEYAGYFSRY